MEWYWLPDGEGVIASGRENVYLIAADLSAGLVTGVRLTRWRGRPNPAAWDTALEASRNVIAWPFDVPCPAGSLEVAVLLDTARDYADRYESGEPLEDHPAWQQPPRPIAVTKP